MGFYLLPLPLRVGSFGGGESVLICKAAHTLLRNFLPGHIVLRIDKPEIAQETDFYYMRLTNRCACCSPNTEA